MNCVEGTIVGGTELASSIRNEVRERVLRMKKSAGRPPRLDVLLIGDDPASKWYANAKCKLGRRLGIDVHVIELQIGITAKEAASAVSRASNDSKVDGVLIELPLPSEISLQLLCDHLDPKKDVDGITSSNRAALFDGREQKALIPATALACVRMIEECGQTIEGSRVTVVGRGLTVGRPVAVALVNRHATVTVCHSRTRDLPAVVHGSEVVVAAAGVPRLLTGAMVQPGAVVIDAGTNQIENELVGDVERESVVSVASALTPVPGGVGTVTTAMIMANVMRAISLQGIVL